MPRITLPSPAATAQRIRDGLPRPQLAQVGAAGRQRALIATALFVVVVVGFGVFGAVTLNAVAADEQTVAAQLDRELRDAEARYSTLLVEIAELEEPSRVAREAAEAGLVRVDQPRQLATRRPVAGDRSPDANSVHVGDVPDHLKSLIARRP